MRNLRLTIDLVPQSAWGSNLRTMLGKTKWDALRNQAYERANHQCTICERKTDKLDAHEVWDYDIPSKTQTLTDIIALCKSCHFVKHIRQAKRIGVDKHAREHFMRVNNCGLDVFVQHFMEAETLFNERGKVDKWELKLMTNTEEVANGNGIR